MVKTLITHNNQGKTTGYKCKFVWPFLYIETSCLDSTKSRAQSASMNINDPYSLLVTSSCRFCRKKEIRTIWRASKSSTQSQTNGLPIACFHLVELMQMSRRGVPQLSPSLTVFSLVGCCGILWVQSSKCKG